MRRKFSIFLAILILQTIWSSEPKIWAEEGDLAETKSKEEIQRILKLRVEVKTREEEEILKAMGLKCEWSDKEAICDITVNQLEQLKQAGLRFKTLKEGIRIESKHLNPTEEKGSGGNIYAQNTNNYSIPYQNWTYSPITISSAPSGSYVTSIDVSYGVIHTCVQDLLIKLTDQDSGHEYILWNYEGGCTNDIFDAEFDLPDFNGEWVNQTWKLWGYDCCAGDTGYINEWAITIWYEQASDLIVQSLTATNYNPNVGENINVTMVIKNQGSGNAAGCWNGLFYNLSSPPTVNTSEDQAFSSNSLDSGFTYSFTFYNITSAQAGVWHMYGLADCDSDVTETNENNNYKGPVDINWTASLPDLIVQSMTVDNSSLVITEHTNGSITIKNQGSGSVTGSFRTDVFKNSASAPTPPASGQYRWGENWLNPGEIKTYNFYKLPHSTSAGTWKMWGLVDSQGEFQESNEGNNTYGPLNITWLDPPSPHQVSRPTMIDHGLEFVNVNWTCSSDNATHHWSCPTWTCAFSTGQHVTGEAYSCGGWDKPNTDFLTYLSGGLCAGSFPSNNCGQADAYWATGVDCAGLVSRCWETNARKDCPGLVYVSDQITVNDLQSGDIMNRSTGDNKHVMMFYEWRVFPDSMRVIEATPNQCRRYTYGTNYLLSAGYVPRRYKWVYDPGNNDPVITDSLHCKNRQCGCDSCFHRGEEKTIEIDAYDPDGDPLHYIWWCDVGFFIVGGNPVYLCTTQVNYVVYQAPVLFYNQDHLFVNVCDNRGGSAQDDGWVDVFPESYSCLCGDANYSGQVELGDVVQLVAYLYKGHYDWIPDPILRADVNNNCNIDLGDIVYLISYLYKFSGLPPVCRWICSPPGLSGATPDK